MSYCRFAEGDVYLFQSGDNTWDCCCCSLAPLIKTIATAGHISIFEECSCKNETGCEKCQCPTCKGIGCENCMMHSDTILNSLEEVEDHLLKHRAAGHNVPQIALNRVRGELCQR